MKSKATRGTGDPNRPRPPDDPEQSKRFEEKAREIDADEDGLTFERAFGVVARHAPPKRSTEPLTQGDTPTIVQGKKKRAK